MTPTRKTPAFETKSGLEILSRFPDNLLEADEGADAAQMCRLHAFVTPASLHAEVGVWLTTRRPVSRSRESLAPITTDTPAQRGVLASVQPAARHKNVGFETSTRTPGKRISTRLIF